MINRRLGIIECDGCGVGNDGDPIDQIGRYDHLIGRVAPDPHKMTDIQKFWLCPACSPEYPRGPEDFFSEEFWEKIILCANCNDEEVDEPNHWCDYCADNLSDPED